jgi:dTDP-4-dehydrorhamnose reductase
VREARPLTIVRDQIGSPTHTVDLGAAIFRLLENRCRGIFHVTNSSSCSWYEFAREIVKAAGISDVEIIPVDGASLERPARRPNYSVLDCEKLEVETGLTMRPWHRALREFLNKGGMV